MTLSYRSPHSTHSRLFVRVGLLLCAALLNTSWSHLYAQETPSPPKPPETFATTTTLPPHLFIHLEGALSLLNDAPGRSVLSSGQTFALRSGYSWGRFGTFLHLEQNRWLSYEVTRILTQGSLNVGSGFDLRLLEGRVRTSVTLGPSFLLFDTPFHKQGTLGLFLDLRPGGIRWDPFDWVTIEYQPLQFVYLSLIRTQPTLQRIEYRTTLTLEWKIEL